MFNFLSLNPEAFGIDISDMSLKIVKLKKRGKLFDIKSFIEQKIKSGIVINGEIKNQARLSEIIKEAVLKVNGEKLGTNHVIASLPEQKAFLRVIDMPLMSQDDLKSAVIYEAENYVPMPIEEIRLDFQVISSLKEKSGHCQVLIVALPKKIVESYVSCLEGANLEVMALEIESLAISRALLGKENLFRPYIIINLGAAKTDFIVFSGGSLRFVSSIPVSSFGFTQIISENLSIGLAEAEELKIKYGLMKRVKDGKMSSLMDEKNKKESEERMVFESLIPALVDLTQQIKRHIEYYCAHFTEEEKLADVKKNLSIIISGGGSNLKGLSEYLSVELKMPVVIGEPWASIISKGKEKILKISPEETLSYTTAIGLAMRGASEE